MDKELAGDSGLPPDDIAVVLLIARRKKLQPKDYWTEAEPETEEIHTSA